MFSRAASHRTDRHVLTRADVVANADGSYTLHLRTSNTTQVAGLTTIPIILAREPTTLTCPATHLAAYLAATADRPPTEPLFGYYRWDQTHRCHTWTPLTYNAFLPASKQALNRAGYRAPRYGAHSPHRGPVARRPHAFFRSAYLTT